MSIYMYSYMNSNKNNKICNLTCFFILLLLQILFCRFLENGNRYKAEIFNVHFYYNKLSKNISHFFVA